MLCKEKDQNAFDSILLGFMAALDLEEKAQKFIDYFRTNYCTDSRISQWAGWARARSPVNNNMFIERMHRTLKYKYLDRKESNRLDSVISALLVMSKDYRMSYIVRAHARDVSCHRLVKMNRCHRASLKLGADQISSTEDPGVWSVVSEKDTSVSYEIR